MIRDSSPAASSNPSNKPRVPYPILSELQTFSQRFSSLEQQATKDRQLFLGLVSEFRKQGEAV